MRFPSASLTHSIMSKVHDCATGFSMEKPSMMHCLCRNYYSQYLIKVKIRKKSYFSFVCLQKYYYLCIRKIETNLFGALVQLVRMPACHAGGHEFEPRTHRKRERLNGLSFLFVRFSHLVPPGSELFGFASSSFASRASYAPQKIISMYRERST